MPADGYVITSDDIKNLAKVLRQVSPELGRELRRGVRTAAKPVISEMKDAIGGNAMNGQSRAVDPSRAFTGGGSGGITAKMQRAVRLRISGGKVRIYVNQSMMGSANRVPAYIDAGKAWRHPVMGNRSAWVSQAGSAQGWFTDTATKHFPQITNTVQDVLDDVAHKVAAML